MRKDESNSLGAKKASPERRFGSLRMVLMLTSSDYRPVCTLPVCSLHLAALEHAAKRHPDAIKSLLFG